MSKASNDVLLEKITELGKSMDKIEKRIDNFEKNIVERVDKNTKFRIAYQANAKMIKYAIGSGWGVTLVALLMMVLR